MSPLLAHSGHLAAPHMSASDPKRALAGLVEFVHELTAPPIYQTLCGRRHLTSEHADRMLSFH